MNDERPAPLVPADCDLRDFAFMPLDVARLRDSGLAAEETPDACWAGLLLWAASWHQVPAAAIPNDDRWIAKHAGYAQRGKIAREWDEVRAGALRNWVQCNDGRLYHPVVAEKAVEGWAAKCDQRWRAECARIKKHNDRHETDVPRPSFVSWMAAGRPSGQPLPVPEDKNGRPSIVPEDKASKGQLKGQGQGQGQGEVNTGGASPLLSGSPPDEPKRTPPAKVNGKPKAANGQNLAKDAREVLGFLNERAGKRFPETASNVGIIVARFKEGFTPTQVRQVVALKVRDWKADPKMAKYLRPETLFGPTKFSGYVGELVPVDDEPPQPERITNPDDMPAVEGAA